MIPKIIHYCWFGKQEKPPLVRKCMQSWFQFCPDWKFVEWNETNAPIDLPYVKNALNAKRYAFASDYVRFYVLKMCGGIYLDTDVEIIKSLDPLIVNTSFLGRESSKYVNAAVMGSVAGHPFMDSILKQLDLQCNNTYTAIPEIITSVILSRKDLENDLKIYEPLHFYPYNPFDDDRNEVKQLMFADITNDTYTIHHYAQSWNYTIFERVKRRVLKLFRRKI